MSRRARNMNTVRRRGRNSRLALLGVLLTAISLMTGALGCDSAPHYLEIRDWHDLYAVRGNLGGHYVLMNDLDSTTAGYGELAGNTTNQGRGCRRSDGRQPGRHCCHVLFRREHERR